MRVAVHRVGGVKTVAGALLFILIPEIAALPDAMAQAGKGADGDGVVSQHILRIMAGRARPTFSVKHRRNACVTGWFGRGDPPGRPYLYSILSFFAML